MCDTDKYEFNKYFSMFIVVEMTKMIISVREVTNQRANIYLLIYSA